MRAGTGARCVLHDAARPLASPALAEAVTEAVAAGHAVAVPVLPLSDTVKHVDSADVVAGSPDRTGLRVLQTPQAFRAGVLRRGRAGEGARLGRTARAGVVAWPASRP